MLRSSRGDRGWRAAPLLHAPDGRSRRHAVRTRDLRDDGKRLARGGARPEGAAGVPRLGAQAGGKAQARGLDYAPRLSLEQHVPRRGGPARSDHGPQAAHAARPARGQPDARCRAREVLAHRRVPAGGAPDRGRARTQAVLGPEPVEAHEARRDEALQVRRDGAALSQEPGTARNNWARSRIDRARESWSGTPASSPLTFALARRDS